MAIREHVENADPAMANFDERLIYSIQYRHNGTVYEAQVGKIESKTGELIHAILGNGPRLVLICTTNRGANRGDPILVGGDEIIKVMEFAD